MTNPAPLHLFQGYGIELEYMLVDSNTLQVKPISDQVLTQLHKGIFPQDVCGDVELGPIGWSNELVKHVIELKGNGPSQNLVQMKADFQAAINDLNSQLLSLNTSLMPSAMHPWFQPFKETVVWDHDYQEVYQAYNKIFDCRGHGWSNLQSIHINLPFSGDEEFGRLHAAIRLILPILPAVAASSPIYEDQFRGAFDSRLLFYFQNQRRIPRIIGQVIPEPLWTNEEYQDLLLKPLYREISEFDPTGLLQHEWLNSRGAIARFDRNAIEIRLLDIQESLAADFAIISAIISMIIWLVEERPSSWADQKKASTTHLAAMFHQCLAAGPQAQISDPVWRNLLGIPPQCHSANQIWHHLGHQVLKDLSTQPGKSAPLEAFSKDFFSILDSGLLAERILHRLTQEVHPKNPPQIFNRAALTKVYRELVQHLSQATLMAR